jgi:lysozyme family protein
LHPATKRTAIDNAQYVISDKKNSSRHYGAKKQIQVPFYHILGVSVTVASVKFCSYLTNALTPEADETPAA